MCDAGRFPASRPKDFQVISELETILEERKRGI